MSPSSFTFTLSVPNDPELASMVMQVARHAAVYANLGDGAADGFIDRTRSALATALAGAAGGSTSVVIAAADGTLSARIGSHTVTAPLP